jgi:hypothetical protein
MEGLDEDLIFVDNDVGTIANAVSDVLGHVNTLTNRVGATAVAAPSPPVLSTSSVIMDDSGLPLTSMGTLLSQMASLVTENARLGALVGSQGGIAVGSFTFPSIEALGEVIDRELSGDYPWEIFVDVGTLHIHNPNVETVETQPLCWIGTRLPRRWLGFTPLLSENMCVLSSSPFRRCIRMVRMFSQEDWPRPSKPQPPGLEQTVATVPVTRSRIKTTQPGWRFLRRSMGSWLAAQSFTRWLYTWWTRLRRGMSSYTVT